MLIQELHLTRYTRSFVCAVFISAFFICAQFQKSTWIFGSCKFSLTWRSKSFICALIGDDVYYWLHLYVFGWCGLFLGPKNAPRTRCKKILRLDCNGFCCLVCPVLSKHNKNSLCSIFYYSLEPKSKSESIFFSNGCEPVLERWVYSDFLIFRHPWFFALDTFSTSPATYKFVTKLCLYSFCSGIKRTS